MKWIKVQDKMPDQLPPEDYCSDCDYLFVFSKQYRTFGIARYHNKIWNFIGEVHQGVGPMGIDPFEPNEITHWALLESPNLYLEEDK